MKSFTKLQKDRVISLHPTEGPHVRIRAAKGKKVFFIRFIPPGDVGTKDQAQNLLPMMGLSVPIKVPVDQSIKAGKLDKLDKPYKQSLEWIKKGLYQFASGAFRDAFGATATHLQVKPGLWVIKQYQEQAVDAIARDLNITLEDHTWKQIQMHMAARSITTLFSMKVPSEFGKTFQYNKGYYAVYKDQPVTVKEFVDGEFHKYVNNGESCMIPP